MLWAEEVTKTKVRWLKPGEMRTGCEAWAASGCLSMVEPAEVVYIRV